MRLKGCEATSNRKNCPERLGLIKFGEVMFVDVNHGDRIRAIDITTGIIYNYHRLYSVLITKRRNFDLCRFR